MGGIALWERLVTGHYHRYRTRYVITGQRHHGSRTIVSRYRTIGCPTVTGLCLATRYRTFVSRYRTIGCSSLPDSTLPSVTGQSCPATGQQDAHRYRTIRKSLGAYIRPQLYSEVTIILILNLLNSVFQSEALELKMSGGYGFKAVGGGTITFADNEGNRINMNEHIEAQNQLLDEMEEIVREATLRGEAFPGNLLVIDVSSGAEVVKAIYQKFVASGRKRSAEFIRTGVWLDDPKVGPGHIAIKFLMPMGNTQESYVL